MSEVNVILLCNSRFALPALQQLAFFNMIKAVAIPVHSIEMMENVQVVLTGSGIPILELHRDRFREQLVEAIEKFKITLGLVMGFSYKIPAAVYNLPTAGFFNVHPGPLPEYRGADPVFRQIENKENLAGVTIHQLDDGWDTGPVVLKEFIRLDKEDTYGILTSKIAQLSASLVGILIKLVSFEIKIPSRAQDESKAVYYKKQGAKDISIDWMLMDADRIIALINACNPWNKGAVTKINNRIVRLLHGRKLESSSYEKTPGTILSIHEYGLTISTITDEALLVSLVYTDEGFFHAKRLDQLQVMAGDRFENIG